MTARTLDVTMQKIEKEINDNPEPISGMDTVYKFEIDGEVFQMRLKASLVSGPRRSRLGHTLHEGGAVGVVLGEQHPLGDLRAVAVAVASAEQHVDVVTVASSEVLAVLVEDGESSVPNLAAAGGGDVELGLGALHHLRGVETGGSLDDLLLGGGDSGVTSLEGLELGGAGFVLLEGGVELDVLVLGDVVLLGQLDDAGAELLDL